MTFCTCENPRVAPSESNVLNVGAANSGKTAAIRCELCGLQWHPSHSRLPQGKRAVAVPTREAALSGSIAPPSKMGPARLTMPVPFVFDHAVIDTEGEDGPGMTQARAISVAEELCEFRAEKVTAKSTGGYCYITVQWNGCNRQTFSGRTWFLALRGIIRTQHEKQQLALEHDAHRAKVRAARPLHRKIIDFFTGK